MDMKKSFSTFLLLILLISLNLVPASASPASMPDLQDPSGDAFSITGYEPHNFDNVSGGTISFYGTGFLPGTTVRLVDYGLLDTQVMNNKAMRSLLPGGVRKGIYDLVIIRPDGHTWTLERAIKITDPKAKATATAAPRNTLVYGRPQVVIQSVETLPEVAAPGDPFTITLQMTNRGDYTATNVRVALNSPELAVPREGSSLHVIDTIAENQVITMTLPLAVIEGTPSGFHNLNLTLEYSDYIGRAFSSNQSIGLEVSSAVSQQPLVLLSAYTTRPEMLSPGDLFDLELSFVNAGQEDAGQVLLTLGGQSSTGALPGTQTTLRPFAILDGGNVQVIPNLSAGEQIQVSRQLIVDGSTESGVYDLPVSLSFQSSSGAEQTSSQMINLVVSRRPQLKINFYREVIPGPVGQPVELPIELVNIGRTPVNVSTVEVGGEDFQVENASTFIGLLEGGTAGTLDASATPQKGGSLPLLVTVHYLDDFNQPQVITSTLTLEVSEPEPSPASSEEPGGAEEEASGPLQQVIRFVRALFGLGGD